jgi:hypothetical protein
MSGRRIEGPGYIVLANGKKGRGIYEHVLVVERAIGRKLPVGAVVHHVDLVEGNNANNNLVVCVNQAYHMLLHALFRILQAGGNPHLDKICGKCRSVKPKNEFHRNKSSWDGRAKLCKICACAHGAQYRKVS